MISILQQLAMYTDNFVQMVLLVWFMKGIEKCKLVFNVNGEINKRTNNSWILVKVFTNRLKIHKSTNQYCLYNTISVIEIGLNKEHFVRGGLNRFEFPTQRDILGIFKQQWWMVSLKGYQSYRKRNKYSVVSTRFNTN